MPGFRGNGGQFDGSFRNDIGWMSFGNGRDGVLVVTSSYTMTQDMFFDSLTISSSVTMCTGGYRLFVKNLLWVQTGSVLQNSGTNATGAGGAPRCSAGTLGGSGQGGAGGAAASNGSQGEVTTSASYAGVGGRGGDGAGGTGGASGSVVTEMTNIYPRTDAGMPRMFPYNLIGAIQGIGLNNFNGGMLFLSGGSGGGGGAGNLAGGSGGGGGAGGGVMVLSARHIINEGKVTVQGGNGATGAANAGSGGGGGGGKLFLTCNSLTMGNYGVFSAAGGSGGPANGTGISGSEGRSGVVLSNNSFDFTPASFYGLYAWYRSDYGVLTSGTSVTQWNDLSGWGRHLSQSTAANQPTYVTGAQNGYPCIRFDGVNDVMVTNVISGGWFSPMTYTMAIKVTSVGAPNTNDVLFSGMSASSGFIVGANTTPKTFMSGVGAGVVGTNGQGVLTASIIVASGVYAVVSFANQGNGVASAIVQNNTAISQAPPVSSRISESYAQGLSLGGMRDATRCSGFDILELVVHGRSTSTNANHWTSNNTEKTAIARYLAKRYNLPSF